MAEEFSLITERWMAVQIVSGWHGNEKMPFFSPAWIQQIQTRNLSQDMLSLRFFTIRGWMEQEVVVLYHGQCIIAAGNSGAIVFSDLSRQWLQQFCPHLFESLLQPFEFRTDEDMQFFLDWRFQDDVQYPEYKAYEGSMVIVDCYPGHMSVRLEPRGLPVMLEAENFLIARSKLIQRLQFYLKKPSADLSIRYTAHLREEDVLTACALRFDGNRYLGNRTNEFNDKYLVPCIIPEEPLDQMALMFLLQRWLLKWGGENEPKNGRYWFTFRDLFLRISRYPVPEEYQFEDFYFSWVSNYIPFLIEAENLVTDIHKNLNYEM